MLIDSHCHLDTLDDLDGVLARAAAAGVREVVTISTRLAQAPELIALAQRPSVWCTVGVHPHNTGEGWTGEEWAGEGRVAEAAEIAALADHPRVIGIGESGLDYFYDTAPRDAQQASFREHIRAARLTGLPVCIHARSADDDIALILQQEWDAGGPYKLLLHCFSSGRGLLEVALGLGAYVSFSGMLTFPKLGELRDMARDVPPDRLLVETDAPYLAPVPHRGKRNEPAWVAHTAAVLAGVRGLDPAALADLTTANFRRLFTRTA